MNDVKAVYVWYISLSRRPWGREFGVRRIPVKVFFCVVFRIGKRESTIISKINESRRAVRMRNPMSDITQAKYWGGEWKTPICDHG